MHGGEPAATDLADILAMARAAIITAVTDPYKFLPRPVSPVNRTGIRNPDVKVTRGLLVVHLKRRTFTGSRICCFNLNRST
jgi:hypothetical protein